MPPWPPLTDDLPAPRDDEPSSLRQDIADELADHLNCAFTRELHLTRDEEKAKEKALDRFGDPRRIARKLWLDAMQEKLMSQRMTFVALVVVLLASLGSTALTWFLVDQSQKANAALLLESRKANEQLLERLSALTVASNVPAKSMEWNPLKVRMFVEKPTGVPAAGFEVFMQGNLLDTGKEIRLARKVGADGFADFGQVRPGRHLMTIRTPSGESSSGQTITVLPGESQTVEAFVPPPLEQADVAISADWPSEFTDRGLWLVCDFKRPSRDFAGQTWVYQPDHGAQYVAISPTGTLINFNTAALKELNQQPRRESRTQFQVDDQFFSQKMMTFGDTLGIYRRQDSNVLYVGVPAIEPRTLLRLPSGVYRVNHLVVASNPSTREDVDHHELLTPHFVGGIQFDPGSEKKGNWSLLEQNPFRFNQLKNKPVSEWIEAPTFSATAGKSNDWKVSLPAPLAKQLSEMSTAQTGAK